MSIRWRSDGRLLCAVMHPAEPGDTYINDRLHYQLSVISRTIIADVSHETNGLWYWLHGDEGLLLRATKLEKGGIGEC